MRIGLHVIILILYGELVFYGDRYIKWVIGRTYSSGCVM